LQQTQYIQQTGAIALPVANVNINVDKCTSTQHVQRAQRTG